MMFANSYEWGQTAGVRPADCVNVKYITGVWMSTGGTQVAYVLKVPNIDRNRNDYQLFIKAVADKTLSPGRILISGVDISQVQWLGDDNRIAVLESSEGIGKIILANTSTGEQESTFTTERSIESFSMDSSGNAVAYSVVDAETQKRDTEEIASGYHVRYLETVTAGFPTKSIYIRHHNISGGWSSPQLVTIENPFTREKSTNLEYARNLSLSPDGKQLFVSYMADGVPDDWRKNPFIKSVAGMLRLMEIMVIYDVHKGGTRLAFKMINSYSRPRWSSDSRWFFVVAHSPVGSVWEAEDIRDHQISARDVNLFEVNVDSGEIAEVFRHVPPSSYHDGPLFLVPGGDLMLQTAGTSVARLHHFKDSWREVGHLDVPHKEEDRLQFLVSNGTYILGVHETVSSPDNLFAYEQDQGKIHLLTDLNPQLRDLRFAPIKAIHWTTAGGLNISGLLFIPPDYVPGRRYPLVIQTKGDSGWFTCDSGASHYPSFAPQPIASAGMMYLTRSLGDDWNYQEDVDKRPGGFPGGINEAVQDMDIWDSAVDLLDKQVMVDPSKVGIIGFSRTGWRVEFDLVHSRIRYAAASAADNVQYSLSEYWLIPWATLDAERMYDGPPYGKTLDNWQKYSISFNLDKVHTPLLMEEMGYNIHDEAPYVLPSVLAVCYEVSKGLTRLGKPVEMYYYPNEEHQPDHPKARLASLQRNLDWYRFWLQGYEEKAPDYDPDQYVRWRKLKALQDWNLKMLAEGKDPATEYIRQTTGTPPPCGPAIAPSVKCRPVH
jgi:dipeptidyl aminopeptidase/acylaminoacyl peptidase